jgi:hypothetical protein
METELILKTLAKLNDKMDTTQSKMDSNHEKAEVRLAKFEEKMAAERKTNEEDLLAKAAKQEELLAEISAGMDTNITKMAAIRSEETIKHQMQHFLSYVDESTQNLQKLRRLSRIPK